MASETGISVEQEAGLSPFVPRLTLDWDRVAPGAQHRRIAASMVFVDISGFTALSERLASFGRVGAEEITDLLQHVFAELLSVAYAAGGSLLKFGGDALLLLFDGDRHEVRAAFAADGMRRRLLSLGHLNSMAGKVRLGMTVGAHSGAFDFFLVGESHRELIVAGPAASRVVELEGSAESGEVMISSEMAAHLEPHLVGAGRVGGCLLASGPEVGPAGLIEEFGSTLRGDATRYLPAAIRRFLVAGGSGAEHRQAVVAFIAFKGTDRLIATAGPEAATEALADLVERTAAACDDHDITFLGSDVAEGGGKLIVVAGAPVGHDDDPERILRAARDIATAPSALEVHIGVNPGPLFSGVVGPPYRLTYTVMGDTVNLAARLAYQVGAGNVLTTAGTLERTRSRFDTTPVEPFHVKGKTEAIEAAIVGEPRSQRIADAFRLPLLGRDTELRLLDDLAAATVDGGRAVEVTGSPGIGKSRLLLEFRDRHPQRRLRYATCTSYESNTPYYPFRGLLRFALDLGEGDGAQELVTRLHDLASELVPWVALVGTVLDVDVEPSPEVEALDPKFRASRVRSVIGELLVALLPEGAILRFDDVHWMDDASRELVRHLLANVVPSTSWLVVFGGREPVFADEVDQTVHLEPLGPEAVETLAREAAARGLVTLDVAQDLAARAGGNPLFLEELLAFSGTGEEIPGSVERVIAARIDRLEPRHRDLLRHAALLGASFDITLLRAITGAQVDDADLDVLEAFVARDAPGTYRFEHDLYREVAYAGLPYRARRELHDRAGRIIETRHLGRTDDVAELLALHYHRAGRRERAWEFNRLAAARARARYALGDAARFLRWGLEAASREVGVPAEERAAAWTELGDTLEVLGNYAAAMDAYARARKLAPQEMLPRLWHKTGIVREREGEFAQALRWYTRAERAIEVRDDTEARQLRARLRLRKAEVRLLQGRRNEVRQRIHELLPEVEDLGWPELLARTHFVMAWSLGGDPAAAHHHQRALALYQELDDLVGQANTLIDVGIRAYYAGAWGEARAAWDRAHALKLTVGNEVGAAIALSNAGEILSDQGHFDDARGSFEHALRLHRAAGFRMGIGMSLGNLGRLASRCGDYATAATLLDEAHSVLSEAHLVGPAREMVARMGELAAFQGDHETARTRGREVLRAVGDEPTPESVVAVRALAIVDHLASRQGATEAFVAVHDRAVAAGSTHERMLADAALAWARSGQNGAAADRHRDAADAQARDLGLVVDPLVLAVGPSLATST